MPHQSFTLLFAFSVIGQFIGQNAYGQTSEIDKFNSRLQTEKDVKAKADLNSDLAERLFSFDFEAGLVKAKEALRISKEADYRLGQAKAYTSIGNYYYYSGDNDQAYKNYLNAVEAIKAEKDIYYPARTYLRLSILFRQKASFDSAQLFLGLSEQLVRNDSGMHASWLASNGLLLHALSKNELALKCLNDALLIRLKGTDSIRISDTWRNIGVVHTLLSQYDSANECFDRAILYNRHIKDPEVTMLTSLSIGQLEFLKGNFDQAIKNYMNALDYVRANTYKRYYATILFRIGELYENQGAYHTAYDYLFNALQEFEKIDARQDLARAYTQIGWCYSYQSNYNLALKNANESISISQAIGDSAAIAQNQNLVGFILFKQKKYEEALTYFSQAVNTRKRIKHWWGVSFTLYNMALVYRDLGNRSQAYSLLYESLSIDEHIGKKAGIVFTSNELGFLYARDKKYDKAEYYLSKANTLAKTIPIGPQLLLNYKNYITLYEGKKNQEKIIAYHRLYLHLKDSLSDEISSDRISKADALFQLQRKASEIQIVNKENELHQQKIKNQQTEISFQYWVILFVATGGIVLLVAVFIIYRLFKITKTAKETLRKQNNEIIEQQEEIMAQSEELTESNQKLSVLNGELQEKNNEIELQAEKIQDTNAELEIRVATRTEELNSAYKELETFFYRTSHDFRRPLTTYLGLVEVAKATLKDIQALELFEKVKDTTVSLDSMLIKLQSLSEVSIDRRSELRMTTVLETCIRKFSELIRKKEIKINVEVDHDFVSMNQILINVIFENLIENAIVFCTPEKPRIIVKGKIHSDYVSITVEDNGQGIPEDLQSRIFEMYYRANDNSKGNGLGLYVVKRLLNRVGGTITFSSKRYQGSTFNVIIPVA